VLVPRFSLLGGRSRQVVGRGSPRGQQQERGQRPGEGPGERWAQKRYSSSRVGMWELPEIRTLVGGEEEEVVTSRSR